MIWWGYIAVVLILSGVVGRHLGQFRAAYTEMLGMMAGMTMGMMTGFVLGFAAAAATNSMFWGNLVGIVLGLALGVYFGRPGGLMGLMDGGLGGVMGGSMGAMLAIMVSFPQWAAGWTAVLLSAIYLAAVATLVVLIERSAPGHAALHRLAPWFTRAMASEIAEAAAPSVADADLIDYYALLGLTTQATTADVAQAYLAYLAADPAPDQGQAEQALATLSDPQARTRYDRALAVAHSPGESRPSSPVAALAETAAAPPVPPRPRRPPVAVTSVAAPRAPRRTRWLLVGVGASAILLGLLLIAFLLSQRGGLAFGASRLPAAASSRQTAPAVTAAVGSDGVQTVDVLLNGDTFQYEPRVITVRQGVPVRFNLSVKGDPGCGLPVVIQGLGVRGLAAIGQVTSMEFTPLKVGTFKMTCDMDMFGPGSVIVTQ